MEKGQMHLLESLQAEINAVTHTHTVGAHGIYTRAGYDN